MSLDQGEKLEIKLIETKFQPPNTDTPIPLEEKIKAEQDLINAILPTFFNQARYFGDSVNYSEDNPLKIREDFSTSLEYHAAKEGSPTHAIGTLQYQGQPIFNFISYEPKN